MRFISETLPKAPSPKPCMKSISRTADGVAPKKTCGPLTEKLKRDCRTSKPSEFSSAAGSEIAKSARCPSFRPVRASCM